MSIAEKLTTIAENEQRVFDAGKAAEHDRFWDKMLKNIKNTAAAYAFAYYGWSDDIYRPNGTIHCGWSANQMYERSNITDTKVPLDVTGCGGNTSQMFANSKIHTVRKLIVAETTALGTTFTNATNLANITFEGVIGRNCNMQGCPLSTESMKSAVLHLKNNAGTADEGVRKLTFSEECWAALEADSTAPDGGTWREYVIGLGWAV